MVHESVWIVADSSERGLHKDNPQLKVLQIVSILYIVVSPLFYILFYNFWENIHNFHYILIYLSCNSLHKNKHVSMYVCVWFRFFLT